MGLKSAVVAGLFLPLLMVLLLIAPPLADGVSRCRLPYYPIPAKCLEEGPSACSTIKCQTGDLNGCIPVKGKNRKEYCLELSEKYCHGQMKEEGPGACQICTTDLCNTGNLTDGGDWDVALTISIPLV